VPKNVLVTNRIMQRDAHLFAEELAAADIELDLKPVKQFLIEEELLPIIGEYDGMIAGDDELTAKVLEASQPRLKVISKWGVGLDSIDLDAAERLGIPVFNTPGAFGEAVAEVGMGYLVMLSRHLHTIDRAVRRGEWPKLEGEGLSDKTLGIIGFGAIGRGLWTRARGFGMKLLAQDVRADEMESPDGGPFVDLDRLLRESDYIALCCNLTAENRHMIDAAAIETMKPGARIVNLARGPLIDEPALVAALQSGRLAGAALDVFQVEPLPGDHPLTKLDCVVLGSHNANNLKSANDYVNRNSMNNLLRILG
jgi:D-3-phosphoglycerate dehydrogenase / 2-oxoglutarate reductase